MAPSLPHSILALLAFSTTKHCWDKFRNVFPAHRATSAIARACQHHLESVWPVTIVEVLLPHPSQTRTSCATAATLVSTEQERQPMMFARVVTIALRDQYLQRLARLELLGMQRNGQVSVSA